MKLEKHKQNIITQEKDMLKKHQEEISTQKHEMLKKHRQDVKARAERLSERLAKRHSADIASMEIRIRAEMSEEHQQQITKREKLMRTQIAEKHQQELARRERQITVEMREVTERLAESHTKNKRAAQQATLAILRVKHQKEMRTMEARLTKDLLESHQRDIEVLEAQRDNMVANTLAEQEGMKAILNLKHAKDLAAERNAKAALEAKLLAHEAALAHETKLLAAEKHQKAAVEANLLAVTSKAELLGKTCQELRELKKRTARSTNHTKKQLEARALELVETRAQLAASLEEVERSRDVAQHKAVTLQEEVERSRECNYKLVARLRAAQAQATMAEGARKVAEKGWQRAIQRSELAQSTAREAHESAERRLRDAADTANQGEELAKQKLQDVCDAQSDAADARRLQTIESRKVRAQHERSTELVMRCTERQLVAFKEEQSNAQSRMQLREAQLGRWEKDGAEAVRRSLELQEQLESTRAALKTAEQHAKEAERASVASRWAADLSSQQARRHQQEAEARHDSERRL